MNENYLDRFGDQPADILYLKHRAREIEDYTPEQMARYNECTDRMNGRYYLVWTDKDKEGNGNDANIREQWAEDQNLNKAAYNTLNWLLLHKGRQIILPPIKP